LPEEERVIAVAAGGTPPIKSLRTSSEVESDGTGCAIVAMDNGFIRFVSGSGIQRYIWNIGGDVVSMVSGHEWAFVVHREGGTSLDGELVLFR
jgi:chromosome transmission fidelity protein 4